ncbi:DUF3293 domain-containing protein [Dermatobacter hominis]|uniref:DUF3293 domain-containing protein n=1 Tax=Dermatobacter hominis TaxID=2884263 RepID=UPI001D12BCDF|nr:DUF3293 domain-containing protein [Dermatobacter hominis]UDY34782.1 DUF3293 domain-containing protein [Dermatobacter hominis]
MSPAGIGREPEGLTLELARRDAELRGIPLDEALTARAAAFVDSQALVERWDGDVELEIELDGRWRPALEVARSTGTTWALLTAMDPLAQPLPDEVNEERNRRMAERLRAPLRSVGRARDGSWEEAGFAVPFDRPAIDAAQDFAQAAIYRVTPEVVQTVFLVGADPADLERLVGRSSPRS